MARILRRRVVQMPKVASGRRNLASEINQYLQLGLTAGQIIEKIIPDDPKTTPEAYGEMLRARLLGTGQENEYDRFTKRQLQQPSPPGAKAPLSPAPTPAPSAEGVVPRRGKYLPEQLRDALLPEGDRQTSPSAVLASDAAVTALTSKYGTDDPAFEAGRNKLIELGISEWGQTREEATASADEQIDAEMQRVDAIAAATPVPPAPAPEPAPEPAPKPEPTQADRAVVSGSVSDAARAREETFQKVMANFNKGLAIVEENSNWWNRGEKIDKYIAAFERNLAKSPLMNSGSAKARRDAVDVYRANLSAATARDTRASIEDVAEKNREATAAAIERRAVLKKEYLAAKDGSDREFAEFKKGLRVDLEKLLQRNRLAILSRKQKNRERTQSSKVLLSLLTQRPSKTPATQAQKDFAVQKKEEIKALNDYEAGVERLEALVAATDDLGILLADDIDLDKAEVKRKQEILSQRAIVNRRRLAHMGVLERMREAAGQDPELLNAIPEEMPEYDYSVLLQSSDETEVGSDGEDDKDLDEIMKNQGLGVPQ